MPSAPTKVKAVPSGRSLVDYVTMKRREKCGVCALPDEIRSQLAAARDKKIERRIIRDWLKADHGLDVPESAFTTHSNGHHGDGV